MNNNSDFDIITHLSAKPFSILSFDEKLTIINDGKPIPQINLTKVNKTFTRKFNFELYKNVPWLCGSHLTNKLFCWPCVLFSREKSVWSDPSEGYGDLNNIHNAIQRHEKLVSHIQSCLSHQQFGKTRLDLQLDKHKQITISNHNEEVSRNREILKRLIRITCLLGMQELSFRGHNENESSENRGNYVEFAYCLAEFDEKMESHLKTATVFKGLSKTIQNDIIHSVSSVLLNTIKRELMDCKYIAILIDETSDISCFSQLSTIVRYVDKDGNICERFLGFKDVGKSRSANDISQLVLEHLDELKCTKKLIAQSYDGAAVTASEINGVQAKVKEVAPEAMFIHCYAHKLNLVLSQAVLHIPKCNTFFSLLYSLSSFFSSSTKRTSVLDDIVGKRFPKLAKTRWNYSSRLVETVKENMESLKNLFDYIQENPTMFDGKTKNEARGLFVALISFDTIFLLEVFSKIYPLTDHLFNVLQAKPMDIIFCSTSVENTLDKIQNIRDKLFNSIWEVTVENCGYPSSRKKGNISAELSYQEIYFELLDQILEQLKMRLMSLKSLEFLGLFDFKKIKYHALAFPEQAFQSLQYNYSSIFDFCRLKSELTVLYSHKCFAQDDIHKLLKYIINSDIRENVFPEVHSLLNLLLTLPVTSVEQSFSALKRVKTYLRNSQGQERLSDLSLISIEKSLLKKEMENKTEFYNNVIEEFCKKTRRVEFQYKY